jgi:hypothetical protein
MQFLDGTGFLSTKTVSWFPHMSVRNRPHALFFALGLFAFAFQRSCAKRAKSAPR